MKIRSSVILVVSACVLITVSACAPAAAVQTSTALPAASYAMEAASTQTPAGTMMPPSTGGETEPNDEPYGDVFYQNYGVNPFIDTEDDHFSTFAVDVDTASYTIMRRMIGDGYLPDKDSVRVEEYINFFEQGYERPAHDAFAIHIEGAPSLYGDERYQLVRVGLQGYEVPAEERPDAVLTFVIDVSGSMDYENRLGLVKEALFLLVDQLRPSDSVAIVVYGSRARVVLEPSPVGKRYDRIRQAIADLEPEGATNAEEGLVKAYQIAARAFDPDAINRVILCSDGVANIGNTGPDSIMAQIREYATDGIYLTSVGFGMGNYNDVLMEQLADTGDGFYAYVDDIREAKRVFVDRLTTSLQVIARDAKIQVDFNPDVVSRYQLIGYENRDIADQDFRNDSVDAGELGPGHSVTALYEVKFQSKADPTATAMTVYVRYEDPESGTVTELSRSLAQVDFATAFSETSPRFQFAAVVAEYAEILRESYWARESDLAAVASEAQRIAEYLPHDADVQEFAQLADRSVGLNATR